MTTSPKCAGCACANTRPFDDNKSGCWSCPGSAEITAAMEALVVTGAGSDGALAACLAAQKVGWTRARAAFDAVALATDGRWQRLANAASRACDETSQDLDETSKERKIVQ